MQLPGIGSQIIQHPVRWNDCYLSCVCTRIHSRENLYQYYTKQSENSKLGGISGRFRIPGNGKRYRPVY
jgi:hypothetical protein